MVSHCLCVLKEYCYPLSPVVKKLQYNIVLFNFESFIMVFVIYHWLDSCHSALLAGSVSDSSHQDHPHQGCRHHHSSHLDHLRDANPVVQNAWVN